MMTEIKVKVKDNVIQSIDASGHSNSDHVCGAITNIIRSYVHLLEREGVVIKYSAPSPGIINLNIIPPTSMYFIGASKIVIISLSLLADEMKEDCSLEISKI